MGKLALMIPEDTFGGLHLGLTGASHFRFTVRVLDPRDLSRNKQREPSQSEVLGTGRQMEGAPARWPRPRPAALGRQESDQGAGEAGGSQRPMGTFRTGMPVNVTTPAQTEGRMITRWFPQRG